MQQEIYPTSVPVETSGAKLGVRLHRPSARTSATLGLCLALLLLAVLPPLLSLNRYQRRVTSSMSQVLGRPVHLDRITLNLLPLPSFTLENLVIDEAPGFGAEPIIRANRVNARLRIGSLWRHRVEFSRITFTDPSVNLVHLANGQWNLAGILLQASHVDAAPTTQTNAGDAPRFPYIEATGARINLKLGQEKTPFSLTDADFALWLPQPRQWKMRIAAKPARTDINVSDAGTLQIEAELDRAATLGDVPLTAEAHWTAAQLGATSRMLTGADAGLRGLMNVSAHLTGTLSAAHLQLRTQIDDLHRADFVPEHSLMVDIDCSALATHVFHAFDDLRCSWPVPDSQGAIVALTGSLPDLLDLSHTARVQIGAPHLPASVLSDWAHVLSDHIPADTHASGSVTASLLYPGQQPGTWEGHADFTDLSLAGSRLHEAPLAIGDATLRTVPGPGRLPSIKLSTVELPLGGHDPATLDGSADAFGYTLHLAGMIAIPRLLAVGATAPQFGEGLAAVVPRDRGAGPTRLDLTAHRAFGAGQVWTDTLSQPSAPQRRDTKPAPRRRGRR